MTETLRIVTIERELFDRNHAYTPARGQTQRSADVGGGVQPAIIFVLPAVRLRDRDWPKDRDVPAPMSNKSNSPAQLISLRRALHGIGESFAAHLHTGNGNFTIPIAVPPGRNWLQPQLLLTYSTGTVRSVKAGI